MPGLTTELTGVPSAFMTSIQVLPSRDTWMVSRTEGLQPEGITINTGALPFGMLIPVGEDLVARDGHGVCSGTTSSRFYLGRHLGFLSSK